MNVAPVVLTLDELLVRRATMVRRWTWALAGLVASLAGLVVRLLTGTFDGPPWPLAATAVVGALALLLAGVLPFVEADRRRCERAAREIAAEGSASGKTPAPAAELVLTAGRPGRILWGGRVVGSTEGPGLTRMVPRGEAIRPPERRVSAGGDSYRWLRLELHGRRYLLVGMTRLHLVDDTARCWPLPRAQQVDDTAEVRLLLPADLDGVDVVTVLRAVTEMQGRVEASRRGLRAIS